MCLVGCKPENTPENLKALFVQLRASVIAKDYKTAAALAKSLFPTEERMRVALKDFVKADDISRFLAPINKFKPAEDDLEGWAKLFSTDPNRSEVQVHAATTEELEAYEKGSIAYKEFPGATKNLAGLVLKPKMTFYEVEYVVPGENLGMKYHLLFWDGKTWCMLGPIWRALRAEYQ